MLKTDDIASEFLKMPGSQQTTPNPVHEVLGLNFKSEILGSLSGEF